MGIIDQAIEKGKHISGNTKIDCQIWADFEKEMLQKKVILFGAGACAGLYFERYGVCGRLDGVVDNDRGKQGFYIGDFISEAFGLAMGETKISDISLLDSYNSEDIVILIASINNYNIIMEQLRQAGITNCFVLLIMEANRRKSQAEEFETEEDRHLLKEHFARKCCEQEDINSKKIFFKAYRNYCDHGKYITEALLKIRKDLDIVWLVNDLKTEVPEGVRKIYGGNWKRFIYEMETSAIWILDLAVPDYIIKRRGQLYIQTKHWPSITLKRFYLDASTFKTEPEIIRIWKREKKLIDYIITGSDFDTVSCRRGFEFEGEMLQFGSPRSDALIYEAENREKVYEYFKLKREKHILLYVPTYRFHKTRGKSVHESGMIDLDFRRLKIVLEKRFGGEWYILVCLHPSVSTAFAKVEKPDFVIDAGEYGDSQELVSASDILISDFSSIMFEAAFANKPVFLFTTDLKEYILNEYELLIPYHELPFPAAETNEELEHHVMELDIESYQKKVQLFLKEYGVHEDGHASERAAAFISEQIQKNEVI